MVTLIVIGSVAGAIVGWVILWLTVVFTGSVMRCSDEKSEYAEEQFAKDALLTELPPGVTPLGEEVYVSSACFDDNWISEVGRRYRFAGSPFDVAAYYARKAEAAGWRQTKDGTERLVDRSGDSRRWPSDTCYEKAVYGYTADLQLGFDYWSGDVKENPGERTYWLEISFSNDGGNCANGVGMGP